MEKLIEKFVEYCKNNLDLDTQISDYNYQSMSICIIDCVYSLRANYVSTTKKVVKRYADLYMKGKVNAKGNGLKQLIKNIEDAGGPIPFSDDDHLHNKQKSGKVLKAEVCLNLACYLRCLGIDTIKDFREFANSKPELLEAVIRAVNGMGVAGTNYLFMLAGDPDRCKPDIHIQKCVFDVCEKRLSNRDIQELFTEAVNVLREEYPNLTVSMLDGMIWRKYSTK